MDSADMVFYQNENCLLVIREGGNLTQLFTPFMVRVMIQLQHIPAGSMVYVEAVIPHPKYLMCYYIQLRWYPYYYFMV